MSVQHGVHLRRLQATDELRQLQNDELLQLVRFLVHSSTQLVKETHRISRTSNETVRQELDQTQRDRASILASVDACALDMCSLKEAMAKLEEGVLRCDNTVVLAGSRQAHGDDETMSAHSCGVGGYRGRSPQFRRETQAFKRRTPSIEKLLRDRLVPEAIFAAQGLAEESELELQAAERTLSDGGAGFSMAFAPAPLVLPFYIANVGLVQGGL